MYAYLYDAFLRQPKFGARLARIEGRLHDLGIHGKIEKLTLLKSFKELAEAAIKRGAETIVAVGDDQTVSKIIGVIAEHNVTLGIIPFGKSTRVAEFLGIPEGVAACDVLSARIVEQVDLGRANDTYFLSFLQLAPAHELILECDGGKFHIEPVRGQHSVIVYNFGPAGRDPRDGVLETVISREPAEPGGLKLFRGRPSGRQSVVPIKHMRIKSFKGSLPAYADGQTVVKTPLTVSVAPRKLKVIVGKNRKFV